MTGPTRNDDIELVESYYAALAGDTRVPLERLVTPDWQDVPVLPGSPAGPEGLRQLIGFLGGVFGEFQVEIEEIVATADRVAVRTSARGIHRGELFGVPATGLPFHFGAADFHHLRDGKIQRSWHLEDNHGLLERLRGAHPAG